MLQCFVVLPNGCLTSLQLQEGQCTLGELKLALHDAHAIDAPRIIHHGRELRCNEELLSVRPFDTIRCLAALPGGGKAKSKGGKNFKKGKKVEAKCELVFKEEEQEYAQVVKLLGSSRLTVVCSDGKERLCSIRGKLQRRAWVIVGTIILVSLREWEDGKCDMIHRYTDDEARNLRAYNELPRSMNVSMDEIDKENRDVLDLEDDVEFDFEMDEQGNIDISGI